METNQNNRENIAGSEANHYTGAANLNENKVAQSGFSQADALAIENAQYKTKKKKKLVSVLLITLLIIIAAAAAIFFVGKNNKSGDLNNTSTWKSYANTQAGFSAIFINNPTHITHSNSETYLSKSSDNQNEYSVGIVTGPNNATSSDITSYINSQVKVLQNGSVQSQTESVVDGHSVTDVTFEGNYNGTQQFWTARLFTVGNKIYEPYTVGNGSQAVNSLYFINNFKLL